MKKINKIYFLGNLMKIVRIILSVSVFVSALSLTSCARNRNEVWDDTKSCGRHMTRGISALAGNHYYSRQVNSRGEFYGSDDQGFDDSNYALLKDLIDSDDVAMGEMASVPLPQESPGDPGSSIPGIEAFRDPSTIPAMAGIFKTIHFPYDSSMIKGDQNLGAINRIAEYLRKNPNVYLFIEGHCDERGAEAYNLALGSRRANAVRNVLVQEGANPDNVFTTSYGKERPAVVGHDEDSWAKNRRAEFRVYQR